MTERRERFRSLYDANYERLLGYALRRTDSVADAHDVVGDTFLVAWRRLDEVPAGDRARMWLYGTARKVLANHYRSQRRARGLQRRLELEIAPPATAAWTDPQEVDRISAAFSRLGESDREVLLLSGWEQLDAGQIAQVLGCKRTTARVRLHRARKRFAEELDEEGVHRPGGDRHEPSRWVTARTDAEEAL